MRLIFMMGLLVAGLNAAPVRFTSGETRTHLLELFSSEGCSSCPPAETWLSELRSAPGLWRDFVPVAFPVTYWDRLGWPDKFAQKPFTDRQYAYAASWRTESVYTPAFVLNGREWRHLAVLPAASGEEAGRLAVVYEREGTCSITFSRSGHYEVSVAWLGGGIVSQVRSGENRGRTLEHDFVALSVQTVTLSDGRAELALAAPTVAGVKRLALAVWVTRVGSLTPLQATGGWVE